MSFNTDESEHLGDNAVDLEERLVFCSWMSHVRLAVPSAAITNGQISV